MVIIIDNYDSFTFNLFQFIGMLTDEVKVYRNDQITVEAIEALQPSHIILSPGPGFPENAGICETVLEKLQGKMPILGVCLGHQAIAQVFGGRVVRAAQVMHGKTSQIRHDDQGVFSGLRNPLTVTRYHSLIVEAATLPADLEVTAWSLPDERNLVSEIMGVRHRQLPIVGVQFHPESILSEQGMELLANFVALR